MSETTQVLAHCTRLQAVLWCSKLIQDGVAQGTDKGGAERGLGGDCRGHPGPCCASREASDALLSGCPPSGAARAPAPLLPDLCVGWARKLCSRPPPSVAQGKRDGSTRDEAFAWESREFLRKKLIGQVMPPAQPATNLLHGSPCLTPASFPAVVCPCVSVALCVQGGLCG